MPSQARSVITAISFSTNTVDSFQCSGDIRAGAVDLSYVIAGRPRVTIRTGPAGPVPIPPQPEPPTPEANDPVKLLQKNGWKITNFVYEGDKKTFQPAGFGIGGKYNKDEAESGSQTIENPEFEKLNLSFTFPMYCLCVPNGKCTAANFQLTVDYDGTAHPKIGLRVSKEGDCAGVLLRALDQELSPQVKQLTGSTATYGFATGVTCDCGGAAPGGGGQGDGDGNGQGNGDEPDDDQEQAGGGGQRRGRSKRRSQSGAARAGPRRRSQDDEDGSNDAPKPARQQCPLTVIVEYDFRTVL